MSVPNQIAAVFLPMQLDLGEGPRWHPLENRLYWVDIEQGMLYSHDSNGGTIRQYPADTSIGCLGFHRAGGLILGTGRGFAHWDEAGGLRLLPGPSFAPGVRFNDGAVDRAGRFWAGTKAPPGQAALYRLNREGKVRQMDGGVTICNGIGWSPDNATMYFTDSAQQTIFAYDFDLASGELANRRIFARIDEPGVEPDGLTVDREGGVWSALWGGWRVVRFDPHGNQICEIHLPVSRVTACTFMGPELDTLLITSARCGLTPDQLQTQPLAGSLFAASPNAIGLPEPIYEGKDSLY